MAKSLAHTKWMCKYHIIFTPKYRRKIIYNKYKECSGPIEWGRKRIIVRVELSVGAGLLAKHLQIH